MKLSCIAVVLLILGIAGLAGGQSGRVKTAPGKPTVAPVPVEKPETPPEKPKKSEFPKIVDGERIYLGSEVDNKAFILKKPEPSGTSEAKRHSFHGMVVLHAILGANGQVTNVTIIKGLPYGLTKKSIEAALLIKFRPATKDGEFVSEWVRLEYEFWFV